MFSFLPFHRPRPLRPEVALQNLVAGQLNDLDFPFARHPATKGLYPDFLVGLTADHYIVIEAKPTADSLTLRRLAHIVASLEASGGILVLSDQLDATLTVVSSSTPSFPLVIVGPAGLPAALTFLTQHALLPVA